MGHSWLTAVKRAFRSPTKDSQKKSSRRREESEAPEEEEEEKKREKKRWLFRKPSNNEVKESSATISAPEQKHAFSVAAAQTAVEIICLARSLTPSSLKQKQYAAIIIQTAFRGYIARRALVALKGIVKLQALIRGQNVRKQAKMTLKCMQALLRVQARVRDEQARLSNDGGGRRSSNNLWESRYLRDIHDRKSLSKDRISYISEDYLSECPRTLEDLEAALQARKEAALKRETSLASAFSDPMWDKESRYEKELEERTKWVDKLKWMATKQWEENSSRGSTDHKRDSIKTVEMDTPIPKYINPRNKNQSPQHRPTTPNSISAASLGHRSLFNCSPAVALQQPMTPSPAIKNRPLHVRSGSPRRHKEEKSYSTANTPSIRYLNRLNTSLCRNSISRNDGTTPSYMAATESAKSRVRSQSAPRSRPSTPERESRASGTGLAKKRLSFPVPEPYLNGFSQNLRSPSFKSLQVGYVGMEQQSIYTDSIGGEISPCSTTDLKRWLR